MSNNKDLDEEEEELYISLVSTDNKTKNCEISDELHFRRSK